MATMPKTVKVGWKIFAVEIWPETDARDHNRLGEINHTKQIIKISDMVPEPQQAEILLHEILHAIDNMFCPDFEELARHKEPSETVVGQFTHGLCTVIADNPDLRKYLMEVWG